MIQLERVVDEFRGVNLSQNTLFMKVKLVIWGEDIRTIKIVPDHWLSRLLYLYLSKGWGY